MGVTGETAFDGAALRIVFENGRGNILTTSLIAEIDAAVADALKTQSLKLITIEGAGANFSYGASIQEHAPDAIADEMRALRALVVRIAESQIPVAALVRGHCLGGGFELTMGCHFIFATPDANFGTPEIKLGVFPPVASVILPRLVGQALADRFCVTGESFSGETLAGHGLVHSTYVPDKLRAGVQTWYEATLGSYSASSLGHALRASREGFLRGLDQEIAAREKAYVESLLPTHDAQEGVKAFLAKRKPEWKHS